MNYTIQTSRGEETVHAAFLQIQSAILIFLNEDGDVVRAIKEWDELTRGFSDFELAQQLQQMKASSRWKADHHSWREYLEAEMGISVQYCERLLKVADTFTQEEVEMTGIEKLHLLLPLDRKQRSRLLQRAHKLSVRELGLVILEIEGRQP